MSKKHWYMEFDCARWKGDTAVRSCSAATRGVWIDWLCAMHDDDRSGRLESSVSTLAQLATCSPKQAIVALTELKATKAADVEWTSGAALAASVVVTLINRKMRREFVARKLAWARKLQQRGQPVPEWVTLLSRENKPSYGDEDDIPIEGGVGETGMLGLAEGLWPKWRLTPERRAEWAETFSKHDGRTIEKAIRKHYRTATYLAEPSLAEIVKLLPKSRREAEPIPRLMHPATDAESPISPAEAKAMIRRATG